jgi:hypothetical protein
MEDWHSLCSKHPTIENPSVLEVYGQPLRKPKLERLHTAPGKSQLTEKRCKLKLGEETHPIRREQKREAGKGEPWSGGRKETRGRSSPNPRVFPQCFLTLPSFYLFVLVP